MADLITCWSSKKGPRPVEKQCETFGWPHLTIDGDEMFENTHFLKRDDAWESIRKDVEAYVWLEARALENRRIDLRKAEQSAAEATLEMAAYLEARDNDCDHPMPRCASSECWHGIDNDGDGDGDG